MTAEIVAVVLIEEQTCLAEAFQRTVMALKLEAVQAMPCVVELAVLLMGALDLESYYLK